MKTTVNRDEVLQPQTSLQSGICLNWQLHVTITLGGGGTKSAPWMPETGRSFNGWHPPVAPREWCSALGYTPFQEVQTEAAGWGHSKLCCLETFSVKRRQQEKAVFWRVKGTLHTLHVDEEEFNLLWAVPITAGVQAEARQQIVGPDSPVISTSD